MIWTVCFTVSLCFVIAGMALFVKKRKGIGLAAFVFAAAAVICFPVEAMRESLWFAGFLSVSHGIRMFFVDTGIRDITNELSRENLGNLLVAYKVLVSALYICAPVFTVGLVIQYFSNFFGYIRLVLKYRQDIYVFSELNERSMAIAESIWEQNKKAGIVFCKSDDKDDINKELEENIRQINAIYTMKTLERMKFRNHKRKITYFAASKSDNENLNDTLKLIDRQELRESENIYVYCFSLAPEAEILIDSKEKGKLNVILFDEVRNSVYDQLFRHPLYLNQENGKTINVLIAGGGRIGVEFLKAAAWCGQMNSLSLNIHLIDYTGDRLRGRLEQECPELLSGKHNYSITIQKGDIFSKDTISNWLQQIEDITYCVVALGKDDLNVKAAIMLQRHFAAKGYEKIPYICVKVGDTKKQEAVYGMYENGRLWEAFGENRKEWDKKIYYNIIPFGDIRTMFGKQKSTSNLLDYLARGVHISYAKPDLENKEEVKKVIHDFYGRQGDRRSSIASGIHIKYKLWEMGYGILKVPDVQESEKYAAYRKCIQSRFSFSNEEKEKMYYLEHQRWMAYVRSEGWRFLTEGNDDLAEAESVYRSYYAQFMNKNPILKLHPALVNIEHGHNDEITLAQMDDMVAGVNAETEKVYGTYDPNYYDSDKKIVNDMEWIISGKWHKDHDWIVQEFQINEGESVICKLNELAAYFCEVYKNLTSEDSTETVLYLRECIKSSCYGALRCQNSGLFSSKEKAECYEMLSRVADMEFMPEKMKAYKEKSLKTGRGEK